jgi:tetratricopeptide (TPR) repeat protein
VAATTYYEEAVALHRQLGDTVRTAISLSNLGNTWYMRGDLPQAAALLEEAAALTREIGAKQYIAGVVSNLGEVVLGLGDIPRAASLYRESLELWDHVERHAHPAILAGLGGVAAIAGQAEQAARLFGAATAISETLGVPLESLEQAALDQRTATVRETLGEVAFAATWKAGYNLSIEQAVAAAVATADELAMSLALGARSGFPDPANGQTVPTRA